MNQTENSKIPNKKNSFLFNSWSYNKYNYILFIIGILTIIIGYIIMALGKVNSFQSLNLSPILLFFGYIIIIPISLFLRNTSKKN